MPTPPVGALTTTLQVGTYTPLTDTFTSVLDLNDFATFWIENGGFKIPQPKKTYVRNSNVRFPGENILRYQYQNRHIQVSLRLKNSTTQAILNSIRSLLAAIENPPYVLRIAQPKATQYSYADVVAVSHNIPADPMALLAQVIPSMQIDFECKPGLRGDRIWLQNLVFNPGFDAPNGTPILVFNDGLANANAYTTIAGSAAFVGSNLLTIPGNSTIGFGSGAWGAIQNWQFRFKWVTGNTVDFCIHYVNANNRLVATIDGVKLYLDSVIGGTYHDLVTPTCTLTNGNTYWIKITQFPGFPGHTVGVQASVYNDSAGSVGTLITTAGPVASYDVSTALLGSMAFVNRTATSFLIGGAFAGVHQVSLFAPGGWNYVEQVSNSNICSGAVDGLADGAPTATNVQCYQGGPVTSWGAARIDCSPAGGPINAYWSNFTGGGTAGSVACPVVAAGHTMAASIYTHSLNLSGTAQILLVLAEWNSSGSLLRQTTLQTLTGNQASWVPLSGSVATGANCAYASIIANVIDATTSASAGAIVWFDNAMCWDVMLTGESTMPYCELRQPQTPGQLLVSGVLGDMPAPCVAQMSAYFTSFNASQTGIVYLGRRAVATPGMRFVNASTSPASTIDSSSYGGYNCTANPGPMIYSTEAEAGSFHLLGRALTANGTPTNVTIAPQVFTVQVPIGQIPALSDTKLAAWQGGNVAPFSASSTWTSIDIGQVILPISPLGSLVDPTLVGGYISSTSGGTGGSQLTVGWVALVPVDGDLFVASLANPSGGSTIANWVYVYADGSVPGATTYSIETNPIPFTSHSASNQGPNAFGFTPLQVTPVGDSLVQLDPTVATPNATGVNQYLLHITDSIASELPIACDFVYSPLYLYPR